MTSLKTVVAKNRRSIEVLITLAVLASLIFYYYSIYVPQKEHAIIEQRFRMMKHIDQNAKEKLSGYESLMRNYLTICADPDLNFDSVQQYVSAKNSTLFDLHIVRQLKPTAVTTTISKLKITKSDREGSMLLSMDTIAPYYQNKFKTDSCQYLLNAEVSIADFVKPLLKKDDFNDYIILNDSEIIYQTFPTGLSFRSRDSLMKSKNGITAATDRDLIIAGTNYKLFLQPIKFLNYKDWVLIGLLKTHQLNEEKHHLPGSTIQWLIIVVLLFCFLLPWIKILLMGKSERIKLEDVGFTYLCAMLLVSFIFFLAFKDNVAFRPIAKPVAGAIVDNDSKIFIANAIASNFQKEIEKIYNQVNTLDTFRANDATLHKIISLKKIKSTPIAGTRFGNGDDWNMPQNFSESPVANNLKNATGQADFMNVYWLDAKGNEIANWSANDTNPPPPGNLSKRLYFRNIIRNNTYSIAGNPDKKYFIEPIYSWIDQDFKVALSIPSNVNGEVAVITFKPRSVLNPVMLMGYSYAIVNTEGGVLFHSESDKNLNENLLEEATASKRISIALQTNVSKSFVTEYGSKSLAAYITPIKSLPYSIVVFSDLLFRERRNLECFSFSLMMCFAFFAVLASELILFLCASYRKTRLRKNKFKLTWIYPLESKRNAYAIMLCIYIFALLYLTGCMFFSGSLSLVLFTFVFLGCGVLLSMISGIIYANLDSIKNFKTSEHLLSDSLKVRLLTTWVLIKHNINNNASKWLMLLWFVINVSAFYYLRIAYLKCLLAELVIIIISILLILNKTWLEKKVRTYNYAHLFTAMVFVRLLIICGLPMIIFYVNGYNYDQHVTTRLRLIDFAKQIKAKAVDENCLTNCSRIDSINCFAIYNDQSWVKGVELVDTIIKAQKYKHEEQANLSVIHFARISYTQWSKLGDELSHLHSADLSWHFNSVFNNADTCYLKWNDKTADGIRQKYLRVYGDTGLNYQFPSILHITDPKEILFWLLLCSVLLIFYSMLHYMVVRIYGLFESNTRGLSDMYHHIIKDDTLNNLVYLNGAPGADKMVLVKRELEKIGLVYNKATPDAGPVFILDMLNIPDSSEMAGKLFSWQEITNKAFDKKYSCIIIDHFEYNINDYTANRIKLNLIESFLREGKKKLIIVSTVHQSAFLELMQQWSSKSEAENAIVHQDIPRWNVLFGHFLNLYISLNRDIEIPWKERPDWELSMVIWEECRHTNFLRRLHTKMQSYVALRLKKDPASVNKEDIVLKVQSLAHLFYLYQWNSLTREEQFLIYDLAEDGLINTGNKYLVRRLMNKGMIHIKDGRLTLFNRSFRNFILTSISNNDVKLIEAQIKDNGTWKSLRYPALLILAALSYFIFTAEQENLGDVVKYLSALAAGIPLIIKLLSFAMPAESK